MQFEVYNGIAGTKRCRTVSPYFLLVRAKFWNELIILNRPVDEPMTEQQYSKHLRRRGEEYTMSIFVGRGEWLMGKGSPFVKCVI